MKEQPSWPLDLPCNRALPTLRALRQLVVGGTLISGGGGWSHRSRRCVQGLLLLVEEKRVESPAGGGRRHGPYDHLDGQGHDFSHFVAEDDREEGRERPDGCLDRLPPGAVAVQTLIVPEAAEESDEVQVGNADEEDGASVAVGSVYGHAGVEGEEQEPQSREPRELCHGNKQAAAAVSFTPWNQPASLYLEHTTNKAMLND